MDSIYSKSASSRLAWLRFTVNQLKQACMAPIYRKSAQTCLHGSDIQYITPKHACMDSIYRKSAQTCLHGSDIQYITPKHACMDSIYRKSASNRLAGARFTVNQLQAGLHGPIYSISSAMASLQKKKSPEPWTYHPCPGDFFMRSTVGAAYRRPPPLPPWRGGRLPRAAGSV